jgi:lipoprotein-releasing system permease protein
MDLAVVKYCGNLEVIRVGYKKPPKPRPKPTPPETPPPTVERGPGNPVVEVKIGLAGPKAGGYEYDVSHVYVTNDVARDFVGIGDEIHEIEVRAKDAERVDAATPAVASSLGNPDLRVRDWREMNRSLFAALKLERVVMFALLVIVIVVSGFCIVSILSLMVTEKSREIALLKAIGAKSREIMLCFFFEGVTISFVGTFIGLSVGLGICAGLAFFGLRPNPEQTYIERIPVAFNMLDYFGITASAIIGSSFASIFPAMRAAAVHPVDGLRHE